MEQTMETDVSDETTESDEPAADDEQTDENPVEEGDGDYEELHEESAPTDLDESESEEPDEPVQETVDETEYQEEQDTESVTEPDVMPDPADEPELIPQPSEETDIPPDEVQDEIPDEEADDEPLIEPDDPLPQEPADENVDQETLPEMEPTEELPVDEETEADVQMTVADCIAAYGHVYTTTLDNAMVYADSAMLDEQHIFTISQAGALLLATAYVPETDAVKVWFMASDGEILMGYVHADVLAETPVTDEQADEMANILWFDYADSEAGTLLVFVVAGEKPTTQEETPAEEPVIDDPLTADTTEEAEVPETEAHAAAVGDFLYVTTQTRVFMEVDDTAADDYYGDYFLGYFLRDAAVQVEDVLEDSFGRAWYGISYVFGPDEGDGLICELIGHVYVLADETAQTDLTWRTATDYGYPPDYMRPMLLANYYYDLEDHYGGVASFYVGESGLHATTGHDNEYLPIARHDEYGTIFATPHYMKGETAYCLEHTQNSPVVRDHDSGPYTVVDLAGYKVTPGHSGYIFSEKTMHALAWVLRHTYPFMVLDRSDADNDVWCRVAGQFAMREVIKELEGDFYVMYYWEMDEFYRAYDHAPGVYLDYARWLAAEALDYIENFGNITVADKSVRASGGQYIGTATLYTSAGEMRISKSVGTVTGNSGGDDWEYYYLYSGDTVSITSSKSKFSVPIEIIPSADDEALYYVAVTDADIQKLILPVYGEPYPYQAAVLDFEVPHGAASVTKKDAVSGSNLSGATFELLSGSTVIQTLTTGSGGTATFSNLTPGTYTIREKTAPQGYLNASPNTQTVTVTAGNTASVTFTNNRKTSKIRIQKTDQLTGQALAGAEFTITRLSAPAGSSDVGSVAAVITTDANGVAETGWLEWGRFRITETKVPEDYQDSGYSAEIEAYENGKTYVIDVQNQPIPGYIQLTKTDVNRGTPLSGVQFDIYYNDAYGSGLAGTMTTNADGVARSGALRKGTYQVKEHANPEGYTGELVTLDAIVKPDETTYLSADNQPIQGKIRIQKSDQLTGEALAGAEFTITRLSSSSAAGGAGVGETVILTTDENGVAETGWLDYGTYEVRETKVPVHFVDNSFSQQIAVFEHEKTYTLDVENEPTKGYIQIVKTDALDQTPIEGVQFDIYYNDEYGEGLAATMTTNADGVAVSEPLRKGKYIVREHANPTGYVYDDIRNKLVKMGVPREEVAFIHEANTEVQKKALFAKVRSGQVRVLIGSTAKMGAGTNCQDRLIAIHDADCPWRPGDLEQRTGRIVRQGNQNKEVFIYRYVTEGTFDSYLYQTVENKQKFISQIMTSKSPVRACEDIDETVLSYAEIKALCAGDDRIREKMDLDVDVARLRLMKADHQSKQYRMEDRVLRYFPQEIERCKSIIAGNEHDLQTLAMHPIPKDGFAGMMLFGKFTSDKEIAGKVILSACKDVAYDKPMPIGEYRGMSMTLSLDGFGHRHFLTLKGEMSHQVELGTDAKGNLIRIENVLSNIPHDIGLTQNHLARLRQEMADAKAEIGKPFPQEKELQEKSARLAELDAALNIDKRHAPSRDEEAVAKKPRTSVLEQLKAPSRSGSTKRHRETEAR